MIFLFTTYYLEEVERTDYPICARNIAQIFLAISESVIAEMGSFTGIHHVGDHTEERTVDKPFQRQHYYPYMDDYSRTPIIIGLGEIGKSRLKTSYYHMERGGSTQWKELWNVWKY